jgi:hypothetical protein
MGTMLRLPDPLYRAVRSMTAPHASWHHARANRAGEPGGGEQFLSYHRRMLRSFEETSEREGVRDPSSQSWREIPYWLSQFFGWAQPGYLAGALSRVREVVERGSADELGRFLEKPPSSAHPFSGLHEAAHSLIAIYERQLFGEDHPDLQDADMSSVETSPNNAHFWGLHGWIDGLYERILRRGA